MPKDKVVFYLYFLVIVAVSLAVFYPSFQHTFRSDQIVYFANTRDKTDLISVCKDYFAYEHVRHYYPGDAFLFRPLNSILLGIEKVIFNMHYSYWHIFGFFLHMLTVLFLFRLLFELSPSIFALLFALLYACCYANIEIVIWEHINSYALFNALIMASLFYFERSYKDERYRKAVFLVLFLLLVCAFLHEWGGIFAAMFGACYYFKNKGTGRLQDNKKVWLFFLPGVIYVLACLWVNYHYHTENQASTQAVLLFKAIQPSNIIHVIAFVPRYLGQLVFNGLFPSLITGKLYIIDRLNFVYEPVLTGAFPLNLIAVLGLLILIYKGFSRTVAAKNSLFLLLLGGLIVCQLVSIPLLRLPTHGEYYIFQTSSYYGYFFWGYSLIIVFMAVDWSNTELQGKKMLKSLAMASLIALIFINAFQAWQLNQDIKIARGAWQRYIDKINGFIAVHGQEPGFSFYVRDDVPIQLEYISRGSGQSKVDKLDLASILYYPFYDPKSPKYTLYFDHDGRLQTPR